MTPQESEKPNKNKQPDSANAIRLIDSLPSSPLNQRIKDATGSALVLLNRHELAELFGIHVNTIQRLLDRNALPPPMPGTSNHFKRWDLETVRRWLKDGPTDT